MADLVTLDDLKAYAQITSNTDDALLKRLIAAVSEQAAKDCGRVFEVQPYTDTFRPGGQTSVFLRHGPVVSISTIVIGGNPAEISRFDHDGRVLALKSGVFPYSPVAVAYSAGFAGIPADLQQAVIETVALRYQEMSRVGVASKAMAGETTSYVMAPFPANARAILNTYREVALG